MIIRKSTKEILAESLQELAFRKSVEKITIKEITQNCGVTATTFYNHFADKYELLAWIYNSWECETFSVISNPSVIKTC